MKRIQLDGRYMKTKNGAHDYLKRELGTIEYYGDNLDALWDVLSSYSDIMEIEFINKDILIKQLGEYGKAIVKVFEDANNENPNIRLRL